MSETSTPRTHNDLASRFSRIASGWFTILGIVGLLLVGLTGAPRQLFWMEVDPVASLIHLALGLVGVAMAASPTSARIWAVSTGALLLVWGVLGFTTGGSAGDWATDDPQTVGMHLVIGLAGVVAARVSDRGGAATTG